MQQVPSLLNLDDVAARLRHAEYIQPVAEHVVFPQQNLGALGFQEPLTVPTQLHVAIHFFDGNHNRLVEVHGLGHKPGQPYKPAAEGFVPTHLQVHGQDPDYADSERASVGYRTTPGPVYDIGSRRERMARTERLLAYMRLSRRHKVRYTAPLDVTCNMIRTFWRDFAPVTESGLALEPLMKRRRDLCCSLLLGLPTPVQSLVVSTATGRRMRLDGYNSNPVAADVAEIMGVDIRRLYRHQEAPFIHKSVKPWMNQLHPFTLPLHISGESPENIFHIPQTKAA